MMPYSATDVRRSMRVYALVLSVLALPAGVAAQRAHVDTAGLCLDHGKISSPSKYRSRLCTSGSGAARRGRRTR